MKPLTLHPDRLFPSDPRTRDIARALHATVRDLPIISPHGHTDPRWFAYDEAFANPADLLIVPDHYAFRMLMSQGVRLDELGVPTVDGSATETDPRLIWRRFADHYHLFRGTPSRMWLDWVFAQAFGIDVRLEAASADHYYDIIDAALKTPAFRPRALFERYNIELIATTEGPLDPLDHHRAIRASGWRGRVVTAYRPDPVMDPADPRFVANVRRFCDIAGEDAGSFAGYLRAHEKRRADFREAGATSTDHGHPTAFTANLSRTEIEALYARVTSGPVSAGEAELFRGHMLTEMARMSIEDGMVMQLHPGVHRSHNAAVLARFGRDKGGDIPVAGEFVQALKPLLDAAPYAPPRVRDIAKATGVGEDAVRALLKRVARMGEAYPVAHDHYFTAAAVADLARRVATINQRDGMVRAAPLRDEIGGGRKVAIHILEFFDRIGYTRRVRDTHVLRGNPEQFGS